MSLQNKISQYIHPIVNHPVPQAIFRATKKAASETVLVVASTALLELVSNRLISRQPFLRAHIWQLVVVAPVMEEIFFRGIIQEGIIHSIQRVRNYVVGHVSEEDLKAQEVFRVHVTAFLFGVAHAGNSHPDIFAKAYYCTWSYMAGTSMGHLKEKYNTLSISILAHGLNNALVAIILVSKGKPHFELIAGICTVGLYGAQVFWFLLTRDHISLPSKEQMALKVSQASQYVMKFFKASQPEAIIV